MSDHQSLLFAEYGCKSGTLEGSICNGWLMKKPTNNKCGFRRRRYFVLLPEALLYYTYEISDNSYLSRGRPRGIFELSHKSKIEYNQTEMSLTVTGSKDGIKDTNFIKLFAVPEDNGPEIIDQWNVFLTQTIDELSRKWRNGPHMIDPRKSYVPNLEKTQRLFGSTVGSIKESEFTSPTFGASSASGMGTMQSDKYAQLFQGNTYTAGNTFNSSQLSMTPQGTFIDTRDSKYETPIDDLDDNAVNRIYGNI